MTAPSVPGPARAVRVVLVALFVVGLVLLVAAAWVETHPTLSASAALTSAPPGANPFGNAALLAGAGALLLGGVLGFVVGRRSWSVGNTPAGDDGPPPAA